VRSGRLGLISVLIRPQSHEWLHKITEWISVAEKFQQREIDRHLSHDRLLTVVVFQDEFKPNKRILSRVPSS